MIVAAVLPQYINPICCRRLSDACHTFGFEMNFLCSALCLRRQGDTPIGIYIYLLDSDVCLDVGVDRIRHAAAEEDQDDGLLLIHSMWVMASA